MSVHVTCLFPTTYKLKSLQYRLNSSNFHFMFYFMKVSFQKSAALNEVHCANEFGSNCTFFPVASCKLVLDP